MTQRQRLGVQDALWLEMDKPEYLSAGDVKQLQAASRIVKESQSWEYERRTILLDLDLPPHAVAAITVQLRPTPAEARQRPSRAAQRIVRVMAPSRSKPRRMIHTGLIVRTAAGSARTGCRGRAATRR